MKTFRFWRRGRAEGEAPASELGTVAEDRDHHVQGERGVTSVNGARPLQSKLMQWLAVGFMSLLAVGLLGWYYTQVHARRAQQQRAAQSSSTAQAQGDLPLPALGPIEAPSVVQQVLGPPPEEPIVEADTRMAAAAAPTNPRPQAAYAAAPGEKTSRQVATERRLSGPVFASAASPGAPAAAATSRPVLDEATLGFDPGLLFPKPAAAGGAEGGVFGSRLTPTATPAVQAQVLPTQRLLLPKGAFIDCTLETAIDSSLPGLTTCITATDTFGADGSVVLLERGTKLVGETRGDVQQGKARLFVLWTEARTPTGVVIPLASPGTDELGRSGLPGNINRHFFERFGAAILISVIDGVNQTAVQSQRGGGATVVYNPDTSSDILTEVLKSTINIPPTLTKPNGDRIQILVARDLDFRTVYELKLKPHE